MGYTTDFDGQLKISRPLTQKQVKYINRLNETRRMKRDVNKLMELYKGKHGNPFANSKTNAHEIYGHDGEYFAMEDGDSGQREDASIIDYNVAPGQRGFMQGEVANGQPGLWLGWRITDDGKFLEWDGGEKFYNYTAWLKYLIKKFFIPWGRKLNGTINWYGEDRDDVGKLKVKSNEIFTLAGEIKYEDEE